MTKKVAHRLIHFVVVMVFILSQPVYAAESDLSAFTDLRTPLQTSEYIFRTSPRDSLMAINLFGAVTKPGIYYVPQNTDLLKLLTLAGGATSLGTMDDIIVRKNDTKAWDGVRSHHIDKGKDGAYEIDLDAVIRKEGSIRQLKLGQDDFVYVPQKEPWISNDVSRTVSVVSIILGAALTTLLISERQKENK
ncbi:MAG: SLBB domain-containing protein [Pseudobdellovibrionaceae bacterium]